MGRVPPCCSVLHSEPGLPAQDGLWGRGLGPGPWPAPSPPLTPIPQLPSQPESLVSQPALGRRKRTERKRGWRWQDSRTRCSWAPPLASPQACWESGGPRVASGAGASISPSPLFRLAPPQSTLTSAAFIYFIPLAQPLPWGGLGAGPVLNKHKPRWSQALCSGLRPSLPSMPPLLLPSSRSGATRFTDIAVIALTPHSCSLGEHCRPMYRWETEAEKRLAQGPVVYGEEVRFGLRSVKFRRLHFPQCLPAFCSVEPFISSLLCDPSVLELNLYLGKDGIDTGSGGSEASNRESVKGALAIPGHLFCQGQRGGTQ